MFETTSFLELIHYKIGYKIYRLLEYKNHTNIIIYGIKGCGKSILIRNILNDKFISKSIEKNGTFRFYIHPKYYLFNCKFINNNEQFIIFIKNITQTMSLLMDNIYIIFDNFEMVNEKVQQVIKVIIERSKSCKFIIITNQYNIILPSIRSRCICISIKEPSYFDKYIYMKKQFKRDKIIFNHNKLFNQCKQEKLYFLLYHYFGCDFLDIQKKYYYEIKKIIHKSELSLKDISKIKKISTIIKQLDIPIKEFLSLIIDDFYDINIIKCCADFEYNKVHSYRELLHLDNLFIELNLYNNHIKK